MKGLRRSLIMAGALMVGTPLAVGAPIHGMRITPHAVGPVRLGTTVAAARKALNGFTLKRTSDGDGVALIGVMRGRREVMSLYAGEADPAKPINAKAVIEQIQVWDRACATAAGVRPGMSVKAVEAKYGKVKQIEMSEIESREFATFAKGPAGLLFRLDADGDTAGRYPQGKRKTSIYAPSARLLSISIFRRR